MRQKGVVYSYAPFMRFRSNFYNKPVTCGKIYLVTRYEETGIFGDDWRYHFINDNGEADYAEWGHDIDVGRNEAEFIERDKQDAKAEESSRYLRQQQAQEGAPC